MESSLRGRLILVVGDELLIALDIKQSFEDEGARVEHRDVVQRRF